MAEHEDERSEAARKQSGEQGEAKIVRWFVILLLAFIAFWPVRACVNEKSAADRRVYGYGRYDDLSQIGEAMHAYTENNNGRLPPSLWTLYPAYVSDARLLVSPADIDPQNNGGFLNRCIYLHEGGGSGVDLRSNSPVVVCPHEVDDGQIYCSALFWDGDVRSHLSFADLPGEWAKDQEGGRR